MVLYGGFCFFEFIENAYDPQIAHFLGSFFALFTKKLVFLEVVTPDGHCWVIYCREIQISTTFLSGRNQVPRPEKGGVLFTFFGLKSDLKGWGVIWGGSLPMETSALYAWDHVAAVRSGSSRWRLMAGDGDGRAGPAGRRGFHRADPAAQHRRRTTARPKWGQPVPLSPAGGRRRNAPGDGGGGQLPASVCTETDAGGGEHIPSGQFL